jgi:hypothetical protein
MTREIPFRKGVGRMDTFGEVCIAIICAGILVFSVSFAMRGCQSPSFEKINGEVIMHYDKAFNDILPTGDYRMEKVTIEKIVGRKE